MKWSKHFVYDESSPSCIRWAHDVYTGKNHNTLVIKAGDVAGSLSGKGYWQVDVDSVNYRVSRVIWELVNGTIPDGMLVDHFNRKRHDNVKSNLRLVTPAMNSRNSRLSINNKTGINGVLLRERLRFKRLERQYAASWRELDGTASQRSFSCRKFGEDGARRLAIDCRLAAISRLNAGGAGYTPSHGYVEGCDMHVCTGLIIDGYPVLEPMPL